MGILEGEGTFLAGAPSNQRAPLIRVNMTDEDVVRRVGLLIDRAVVRLTRREERYRQPFATTIKGAPAAALMRAVQPWLGARRQAQIEAALSEWAERPVRWRRATGTCSVPSCTRPRSTRGLCRHHYKLWWKAKRYGRVPRYVPIDASSSHQRIDHGASSCERSCELSWLAGLLEGEGYFGIARQRSGDPYPALTLQMCDEDVVARVAAIIEAPRVARYQPKQRRWNVTFTAKVSGAAAAEWMERLRPFMGMRRTAAIDAALAAYRPIRLVDPPDTCVVPGCDAPHRARGLCHTHYMSWLRDVAKARTPRVTPLR